MPVYMDSSTDSADMRLDGEVFLFDTVMAFIYEELLLLFSLLHIRTR